MPGEGASEKEMTSLLEDLVLLFQRQDEVKDLRKKTAERLAREMGGEEFVPGKHFVLFGDQGLDVKLTPAGHEFLTDWVRRVLSWLFNHHDDPDDRRRDDKMMNHTLLDVLGLLRGVDSTSSDPSSSRFSTVTGYLKYNLAPKIRRSIPQSKQAQTLNDLRHFANVRPPNNAHFL